jgi:hypothetical protein
MDQEDKEKWDAEAGERGKKEGMDRASEHADEVWKAKARESPMHVEPTCTTRPSS